MNSSDLSSRRGDSQLWCIALAISLLVNVGAVALIGIGHTKLSLWEKPAKLAPSPPPETVAMIYPQQFQPKPKTPEPEIRPPAKRFARTSADQSASKPERSPFIGERNTQAHSDRPADSNAPALPSQAGAEPKFEDDLETTESDFQDGSLDRANPAETADSSSQAASTAQLTTSETSPEAPASEPPSESAQTESSPPPARNQLLEGPNPVEVSVPKESGIEDSSKPPSEKPAEAEALKKPTKIPPSSSAKATDPAFSGFQRKTAITGSISRTGRSALDVEDSPLGRYHASISRAVELEWQRNCVRHRDFITPGFLTVRFFVEPSGRVRSVQFVGDMESGEVQKGFTLNSIRNARIPAMPLALRKQYDQEPLELIFRFFF